MDHNILQVLPNAELVAQIPGHPHRAGHNREERDGDSKRKPLMGESEMQNPPESEGKTPPQSTDRQYRGTPGEYRKGDAHTVNDRIQKEGMRKGEARVGASKVGKEEGRRKLGEDGCKAGFKNHDSRTAGARPALNR